MMNPFEMFLMLTIHILLPNQTHLKTLGQFQIFIFVIMSTWENICLIARTPFRVDHYM